MSSVRYRQISTADWNIDCGYDAGTVVEYDGHAYVSLKVVPSGINIGMSNYWKKLTANDDIDELQNAVDDLEEDVNTLGGDIGTIKNQLKVTVDEATVPFQFAYDSENEVYGFMVGEVFHPFGGEVISE